uniref:Uncharacterized protein n=1 Tax=viral metagenome TaxID=1070528 RepID=A0A6C0I8J8_9ZZZZ
MTNNDANISFLLEEKDEDNEFYKINNIDDMMNELLFTNNTNNSTNSDLLYYVEKNVFSGEDETYYNEKYTIKDLMKICCYYGIDKNIKASKCRKQDIVATIVFYEGQSENADIVKQRHNMWAYMTELLTDPKMRMYLLF